MFNPSIHETIRRRTVYQPRIELHLKIVYYNQRFGYN